jgi:hypothetical protein
MMIFRRVVLLATLVCLPLLGIAQLNRYQTIPEASVFLLGEQWVQAELKISPAQLKSIQKSFGDYANVAMDLQSKYRKDRAHKEKYNTPLKAAQKKLIAASLKLLSIAQRSRLMECGIQKYGIFSVTSPDVARAIGMTPEQNKMAMRYYMTSYNTMDTLSKETAARVRAIPQPKDPNNKKQVEAYQKKANEVAKAGRDSDVQKIQAVQAAMEKKTTALLTKAQLAAFEKLKGKPAKMK